MSRREYSRQYYQQNKEKICEYYKEKRRKRNTLLGRETKIGRIATPVSDRIWKFVRKTETCWIWTGSIAAGYGYISVNSKPQKAHRVMYELLVGPIPDGKELDHVRARGCTTTRCVNPDHLEPVSHAENMKRRRNTHCREGHELTEENTYTYHGKTGVRRQCRICERARGRDRVKKMREELHELRALAASLK